jgi:signal transduction histidine kinase
LLQALQKVMMNAVKYTPDGRSIQIQGRSLPGFTDIMIMDDGVGIDPHNLPHIFDSFSAIGDASLHSSGKTKFKGGGPGLGLPIAKGIIDAHGGTIWAESDGYDENECPGSIFHIMVPMGNAVPDETAWRTQNHS